MKKLFIFIGVLIFVVNTYALRLKDEKIFGVGQFVVVKFFPVDENKLVLGGESLYIIRIDKGGDIRINKNLTKYINEVVKIEISPNGKFIAVFDRLINSYSSRLIVFNTETWKYKVLDTFYGFPCNIRFSDDSKKIVAADEVKIGVWNTKTWKKLNGFSGKMNYFEVTSDLKYMMTSVLYTYVYEMKNNRLIKKIGGEDMPVATKDYLFTLGGDSDTIIMRTLKGFKKVRSFKREFSDKISAWTGKKGNKKIEDVKDFIISYDEKWLLVERNIEIVTEDLKGHKDYKDMVLLEIWDFRKGKLVKEIKFDDTRNINFSASRSSKYIAVINNLHLIIIETKKWNKVKDISIPPGEYHNADITSDGKFLIAIKNNLLSVFNFAGSWTKALRAIKNDNYNYGLGPNMAFSPDGEKIFVNFRKHIIMLDKNKRWITAKAFPAGEGAKIIAFPNRVYVLDNEVVSIRSYPELEKIDKIYTFKNLIISHGTGHLAISPDESFAVVTRKAKSGFLVIDLTTKKVIKDNIGEDIDRNKYNDSFVMFSKNGRYLLHFLIPNTIGRFATENSKIISDLTIISVPDWKIVKKVKFNKEVKACGFLGNSQYLACLTYYGLEIYNWDAGKFILGPIPATSNSIFVDTIFFKTKPEKNMVITGGNQIIKVYEFGK